MSRGHFFLFSLRVSEGTHHHDGVKFSTRISFAYFLQLLLSDIHERAQSTFLSRGFWNRRMCYACFLSILAVLILPDMPLVWRSSLRNVTNELLTNQIDSFDLVLIFTFFSFPQPSKFPIRSPTNTSPLDVGVWKSKASKPRRPETESKPNASDQRCPESAAVFVLAK